MNHLQHRARKVTIFWINPFGNWKTRTVLGYYDFSPNIFATPFWGWGFCFVFFGFYVRIFED